MVQKLSQLSCTTVLKQTETQIIRNRDSNVIMITMVPQITGVSIGYSTVCLGANQRKHQSSVSLAFVREFAGDRWIPRTKASNAEKVPVWWRHMWLAFNHITHVTEQNYHWHDISNVSV